MSNVKISIIIPVYNPPREFFQQCVDSLKLAVGAVPKGEVECIFVNDGSTEEYVDEVIHGVADGSNFRFVWKENGGVSTARNIGIDMARGEFLMFVDADDRLEADALVVALKITGEGRSDIICLGFSEDDSANKVVKPFHDTIEGREKIKAFVCELTCGKAEASRHNVNLHSPWAKLYRKSIVEGNQLGFDKELKVAQDFWFNLCFYNCCDKIVIDNRIIYHYVTNTGSAIHRYSDIRLKMNIIFLNRLENFMHEKMDDCEDFKKAIQYQLLKSVNVAMKSYFVHAANTNSFWEKRHELIRYLQVPVIKRWTDELKWRDGRNRREWRDIALLKSHLYWLRLLTIPMKRRVVGGTPAKGIKQNVGWH